MPTTASSLTSFHDFNIATRDVPVSSAETLRNEVTKNTYFLDTMIGDGDIKKLMRGGKKLVDQIQGGTGNTYAPYDPGVEETPQASNNLVEVEVLWTFNRAYYVYDDEEVDLNDGDTSRYVKLKKSYELSCMVDMVNGMEEQLWAAPNYDTMEGGTTPRDPYSLLAFNTRDGEVPAAGNGGIAAGSSAWAAIETLSPTLNTWWKNKTATYTAATPDDPDAGLVKAFSSMVLKTKFEMPTALKTYQHPEAGNLRKHKILTSEDGMTFYEARLRGLNDRMRVINDPHISDIQYKGVPLEYVAQLDSQGWTTNQPDYLFYNFNCIRPIFHTTWFMKQKMTDGGSKQPNRHVVWKFIWWNLFCDSRRRQGRISAV
jgi:hypothetical protein